MFLENMRASADWSLLSWQKFNITFKGRISAAIAG
jgi:hypothetical protein